MNLFSKKVLGVSTVDDVPLYEMVLKTKVEAAASAFGFQLPKDYTRLTYTTPPANEKVKAKTQRQQQLRDGLHEHRELTRPEFRMFLEEESGNLPLVISLYGHMLRADGQITTTLQLIEQIRKIELSDVDKSGRNPTTDKHCFGLVKSVKFMLQRLKTNDAFAEHEREDAFALLTAMSMLDRTQTPLSLFLDHDLEELVAFISTKEQTSPPPLVAGYDCVTAFRERAYLERARDVLVNVGILRPSADNTKFVGVMHQLVQRCVRDQLVHKPQDGNSMYTSAHTIIDVVRQMLRLGICYTRLPQINRDVAPCVEAWCVAVLPQTTQSLNSHKVCENDLRLLGALGSFVRDLQGDAQKALTIHERECVLAKDILPHNHPDIATSMGNLASTFSKLGRHNDALKLQTEVVRFQKRVQPKDHSSIATSMHNLASTFSTLGRHNDALTLQQEVLKFRKRVLPQGHPDIPTSMSNMATTFSYLGRHNDALELQQEVVECLKRVLPQGHPLIVLAISNLASMLSSLGRYNDALKFEQAVLEFRKQELPKDHPDNCNINEQTGNVIFEFGST